MAVTLTGTTTIEHPARGARSARSRRLDVKHVCPGTWDAHRMHQKKSPGFLIRAFGRLLVCGGASFLLFDGLVSGFASSCSEPMLSLNSWPSYFTFRDRLRPSLLVVFATAVP